MATILRDWSYRYQWLYDGMSWLAALAVGGEATFRQLPLQGLTFNSDTQILDLCCGSGQATEFLVQCSTKCDWTRCFSIISDNAHRKMYLMLLMYKHLRRKCHLQIIYLM